MTDTRVTLGEEGVPATKEQRAVVTRGPQKDALSFLQVLGPGCQQVLNILRRKKRHLSVLSAPCGHRQVWSRDRPRTEQPQLSPDLLPELTPTHTLQQQRQP